MNDRVVVSVLFSVASFSVVAGCDRQGSHEPEHASPAPAATELEPMTVTVFGQRALLFMEHPRLVRGTEARFLAHLTVSATGEPVRSGRVVLEIGSATVVAEAPKREGLFLPEGAFPAPGLHPARLTVASEQVEETLDLGEIRVHESEEDARKAAEESNAGEAPNGIPFLMEQQWKVKLLLAEATPRTLSQRLVVPARARAPEGAVASVSSPTSGRLLAPSSGPLPRTGERVETGQVLGRIEPPLLATDAAQLQALSLDLDLEVLEVTRGIGEARARLHFAERERERIGVLRDEGLSTQQQLEQAEQNLSVARTDEEVARATKASLDRLMAERAERAAGDGGSLVQITLRAPIAGTLVAAERVAGESVAAEEEVFRILDPSRLWIEGRVSEFDLSRVTTPPAAFVSFAALPNERFDFAPDAIERAYVSPVVDPASRTFVIRYELSNPAGTLKDGMLAELALETARVEAAIAIPFEAVIAEQGIPTAYVMLSGETFQRRELALGVRDGDLVEVLAGIAPGERVATRGAYIVKLAALSPASFGAGHAH